MARSLENRDLVLLVDDDPAHCNLLARWLENDGYGVEAVYSGREAAHAMSRMLPQVVCLDLNMPDWDGLETLKRLLEIHPHLPIVMLTADRELESAVEAMKAGALDYLTKPVERTQLRTTIRNAVEHGHLKVRVRQLENELDGRSYGGMVGDSDAMRGVYRLIDRVGPSDVSVLIQGDSGTGKELVARALHESSPRAEGPFVALNCGAITESLQEAELFGHEKGAFTGAERVRKGRFAEAHRGTLFLDEVAELSSDLQVKLLRVLQERSFRRLGADRDQASDFRLVAATHRRLDRAVEDGDFRQDLFFRIAVFELEIPPLRRREGDIDLLVPHLLEVYGSGGLRLTPRARRALLDYGWPGNVRELGNALQHAAVIATDRIDLEHLPKRVIDGIADPSPPETEAETEARDPEPPSAPLDPELPLSLVELERDAIERAIEQAGGNRSEMARLLGIGRTTLYRKLRLHGFES
ncbi:MAG: sigma-54 dependent transcriptional regulator [Acidobacteriota bacterium]